MKAKNVAIVLSAGSGKRMNSDLPKQYLLIKGKPVLYYSLKQFQACPFIDEIILVAGPNDLESIQKEIVDKYGITKVSQIVPGGKERYHSVYEGLKAIKECTCVYIHDGARPFVNQAILNRLNEGVIKYQACVAAMPVKDTIKISDKNNFAVETPERETLWMVQTPQVFEYTLIKKAYDKLQKQTQVHVTDDAMVLECMEQKHVKLIPGSYENIKITTPEDLDIAELFCKDI